MSAHTESDKEENHRSRFGGDSRITLAMEDYLKAIYKLSVENSPVATQRLADELNLSGPSVTNMVKRMHDLNLLDHSRYHGVTLTTAGTRVALEVVRHHRIIELYLAEALGYDWDEVHQEAERLEHYVSEELEARMEQALGYPEYDPHGEPIPTRSGTLPHLDDALLIAAPVSSKVRVSRVDDDDPDQLRYLTGLGIRPSVVIEVVERMPFDGPVRVRINEAEVLVPHRVAESVRVSTDVDGNEAP